MSLKDHILKRIQADGPMRIDDYMSTCLLHPTMGYYTSQEPFGAQGDFITAPEISQMFGELLGLCLAQVWMDQGAPEHFVLAELGPGRGTLLADALRACRKVPGFINAARIVLVEASPHLRTQQLSALKGFDVRWAADIESLPEGPLFFVANEFFDALPVRQFVRDGALWRERQVGSDGQGLMFGLGPANTQPMLSDRLADTGDGDLVEVRSAASPIVDLSSRQIEASGGMGLIIDYGDWRTLGDTLQAVRAHKPCGPLDAPGESDLTAHVDFEALTLACQSGHSRVTPQGIFLERLGITERAQQLAKKLTGDALSQHIAAHRRLTHPSEMGTLFKVMALYPKAAAPPPGLEP